MLQSSKALQAFSSVTPFAQQPMMLYDSKQFRSITEKKLQVHFVL